MKRGRFAGSKKVSEFVQQFIKFTLSFYLQQNFLKTIFITLVAHLMLVTGC